MFFPRVGSDRHRFLDAAAESHGYPWEAIMKQEHARGLYFVLQGIVMKVFHNTNDRSFISAKTERLADRIRSIVITIGLDGSLIHNKPLGWIGRNLFWEETAGQQIHFVNIKVGVIHAYPVHGCVYFFTGCIFHNGYWISKPAGEGGVGPGHAGYVVTSKQIIRKGIIPVHYFPASINPE